MSRCTGQCNQGRTCTCFDGAPFEAVRVPLMLGIAAAVVALSITWGFFWGFLTIAQDCEASGSFSAWGAVFECSARGSK